MLYAAACRAVDPCGSHVWVPEGRRRSSGLLSASETRSGAALALRRLTQALRAHSAPLLSCLARHRHRARARAHRCPGVGGRVARVPRSGEQLRRTSHRVLARARECPGLRLGRLLSCASRVVEALCELSGLPGSRSEVGGRFRSHPPPSYVEYRLPAARPKIGRRTSAFVNCRRPLEIRLHFRQCSLCVCVSWLK